MSWIVSYVPKGEVSKDVECQYVADALDEALRAIQAGSTTIILDKKIAETTPDAG